MDYFKGEKYKKEFINTLLLVLITFIANLTYDVVDNSVTKGYISVYSAKNTIADVANESSSVGGTSISNGVVEIRANMNANFRVLE